jgi:hypothetical protein
MDENRDNEFEFAPGIDDAKAEKLEAFRSAGLDPYGEVRFREDALRSGDSLVLC